MSTLTPNHGLIVPDGTDTVEQVRADYATNLNKIDNIGGGGSSTLAGLSDVSITTPVTNDALIYDGAEWANAPLSAVAFSGAYSDLSGQPTIPTKTSDLNNDSNFVSDASYVHTDNNFTNADATKLSGIQAGAEVNVQSDWNEADNTADDYIKNKPTIPTKTSDLNNDSGFLDSSDITVTQVQSTGTKIATIDVDGNSTDLYAPTGGGGSYTEGDGIDITSNTISVDTTFTEAVTRANIDSGDTFSTILGKIKKFFTDLKTVAFTGASGDVSVGGTNVGDAIGRTAKVTPSSSGKSTLLAYIIDVVIPKNIATYTFPAEIFPDLPVTNWGFEITVHYEGGIWVTAETQLSNGNILVRGIDYNNQWVDSWKTLATTSDIPDISTKVSKSGDTMTGDLSIEHQGSISVLSLGTNGASLTPQASSGRLDLWTAPLNNAYKTSLSAGQNTANRNIYFPDNSGTVALTSDLDKVYSTTEKKIGKWIDNRDLYERTVELTGLTAGGEQVKAHGINNIRQVCHWKAMIVDSTGSENLCNDWLPNAPDWGCFVQNVGKTSVGYYMGGSRLPYISKLIVTVQYTKTS